MVVVPTFGPLIGGLLDTAFGWESIFIFTAASSIAGRRLGRVALPETRGLNAPPGAPQGFLRRLPRACRAARSSPATCCAAAFGSSTFFVFLGGGPHVVVTLMERSLGGIRRVVRDLVDRLHGRQFRRLAAFDAAMASTG